MHGEERSACGFGQFDEILPAVGIVPHFPHDALHLFVVHVAVETAHTMAFDEGNHVVFYGREIVWNGRHRRESANLYCMPFAERSAKRQALMRRRGRHQVHEHTIELLGVKDRIGFPLLCLGWERLSRPR